MQGGGRGVLHCQGDQSLQVQVSVQILHWVFTHNRLGRCRSKPFFTASHKFRSVQHGVHSISVRMYVTGAGTSHPPLTGAGASHSSRPATSSGQCNMGFIHRYQYISTYAGTSHSPLLTGAGASHSSRPATSSGQCNMGFIHRYQYISTYAGTSHSPLLTGAGASHSSRPATSSGQCNMGFIHRYQYISPLTTDRCRSKPLFTASHKFRSVQHGVHT